MFVREKKRAPSFTRGIPAELAARSLKCVLSRVGVRGMAPRTAPARARSPEVAREKFDVFTPPRPKRSDGMPVTPLVTRALR